MKLTKFEYVFNSILMTVAFIAQVLGMHEKWEGGNMNYRGGGHKVNLLRRALEPYKDNANMKVMFTDR